VPVLLPDSGEHPALLQLSDYVEDDRTSAAGLLFELVSQSSPGVVAAALDAHGRLDATVVVGQTGESRVVVSVMDASGQTSRRTLRLVVQGATAVPPEQRKDLE